MIDTFINSNSTEEILSQFYKITGEDRAKRIKKLLFPDCLNQAELDNVEKLITKHSDSF